VLIALPGVQQFIEEAHSVADARAASEICSELTVGIVAECHRPGGRVIFPSLDGDNGLPADGTHQGLPNRVVAWFPAGTWRAAAAPDVLAAAELAASRYAGGYRFKARERVVRQFAGHCPSTKPTATSGSRCRPARVRRSANVRSLPTDCGSWQQIQVFKGSQPVVADDTAGAGLFAAYVFSGESALGESPARQPGRPEGRS
jgi:hypothetical protein